MSFSALDLGWFLVLLHLHLLNLIAPSTFLETSQIFRAGKTSQEIKHLSHKQKGQPEFRFLAFTEKKKKKKSLVVIYLSAQEAEIGNPKGNG